MSDSVWWDIAPRRGVRAPPIIWLEMPVYAVQCILIHITRWLKRFTRQWAETSWVVRQVVFAIYVGVVKATSLG